MLYGNHQYIGYMRITQESEKSLDRLGGYNQYARQSKEVALRQLLFVYAL